MQIFRNRVGVGVMAGAVTLIVYFWIMTSKDNLSPVHLGADRSGWDRCNHLR